MSLPTCFNNFIGVRDKCEPASLSGLYINDVEGITLKLSNNIANSDYANGIEFLKAKISLGTQLAIEDFYKFVDPKFKVSTILQYTWIGNLKGNYFNASPLQRGIRLYMPTKTTDATCGGCSPFRNMQSISIRKVKYLFETDPVLGQPYTTTLRITEEDGTFTDFPISGVGGVIGEVEINYNSSSRTLLLTVADAAVKPIIGFITNSYYNCSTCPSSTARSNGYVWANGYNNGVLDSNSYGLNPEVSIICNKDNLFCAIKEQLKYIILYRSALEVAKSYKTTDRINEFTVNDNTSDGGVVDFMINSFTKEYTERYKAVARTLTEFLQRFDSNCIECRGSSYKYMN